MATRMKTLYITPEEYATAEKNGIDNVTVYRRVNYGNFSIERAITEPIGGGRIKTQYEKYKDLCKKNNVSYETFRKRMKRKGMTGYNAATIPVTEPKITAEHRELARQNGIGQETLEQRVYAYKWDPMKAATDPIQTKYRRKGKVNA